MTLSQDDDAGRLMFLTRIRCNDDSVSIGGHRLSGEVVVCITARQNGHQQRLEFTKEELKMLNRVIAIPSDIICKFTTSGVRYFCLTWMESNGPELDSIYLSMNFDEESTIVIRPPLAEQFVSVVDAVVGLIQHF